MDDVLRIDLLNKIVIFNYLPNEKMMGCIGSMDEFE